MSGKFILALDQGTTGTRVIIYNREGQVISRAYREITQYYPHPGWVEQDAQQICRTSYQVIEEAVEKSKINPGQIAALGIANQRETTIFWDKDTGFPLHRAIAWQCRRTFSLCQSWLEAGMERKVREKTGLGLDPYFSASKIKWLLKEIEGIEKKVEKGKVLFGTVDSWLLWNLSGGKAHLTDYTNASRSLVFNIHRLEWDKELLHAFEIPISILPSPQPSAHYFTQIAPGRPLPAGIPITAVMGDQQAALFGQMAFHPGQGKITYGTGCFLLVNQGSKVPSPSPDFLITLACDSEGRPVYAREGSIFNCGSVIQWLRDGLGLLEKAEDSEKISARIKGTGGLYLVPAFTGLGAPYWDSFARGAIFGITRGTQKSHLIRAALEAIAYQVRDLLEVMPDEEREKINSLRVDGGGAKNNFLMQFQADILDLPLERPVDFEVTAKGVAMLAGLVVGFWKNESELLSLWERERFFSPSREKDEREMLYQGWREAIRRLINKPIF